VGLTSYGTPQEILTEMVAVRDLARQERVQQGAGKTRACKQIVAGHATRRARQDRTLLGARCGGSASSSAVFIDMGDAQRRTALFIRPLQLPAAQGIDGWCGGPVTSGRVGSARSLENASVGQRPGAGATRRAEEPLYLTGQVGGKPVSIHAEGERVILTGAGRHTARDRPGRRRGAAEPNCPSRYVRPARWPRHSSTKRSRRPGHRHWMTAFGNSPKHWRGSAGRRAGGRRTAGC